MTASTARATGRSRPCVWWPVASGGVVYGGGLDVDVGPGGHVEPLQRVADDARRVRGHGFGQVARQVDRSSASLTSGSPRVERLAHNDAVLHAVDRGDLLDLLEHVLGHRDGSADCSGACGAPRPGRGRTVRCRRVASAVSRLAVPRVRSAVRPFGGRLRRAGGRRRQRRPRCPAGRAASCGPLQVRRSPPGASTRAMPRVLRPFRR